VDETNVADSGSKPDGSGVPAGAVIGGMVVVDDVVEVVEVEVVVVVAGEALFFDELRLKPTAAPTMITSAATADVITIFLCLVMAFLRK